MREKLINSNYKLYATVTGGAFGLFDEIRKVGQTSKFFAGGEIPYDMGLSHMLIDDSLTRPYDGKYIHPVVARRLATHSYNKATAATMDGKPIGLGVTASLCKSEDERRERANQAFVALYDGETIWELHVDMKEIKDIFWPNLDMVRHKEEEFLSKGILEWYVKVVTGEEEFATGYRWDEFDFGAEEHHLTEDGELVVYMGSFNPWHEAHQFVLDKSEELLGAKPIVGIARYPRGKFELDPATVFERIGEVGSETVVLGSGLYSDAYNKLKEHSPSGKIVFVVGADTWVRIQDDYADSVGEWEEHCRFLVFPRHEKGVDDAGGVKYHLVHEKSQQTEHPPKISSTDIRNERR